MPPAPLALREFDLFTAYDDATRTFTVAASDFPSAGKATFWQSTVSEDVTSATPIVNGLELSYPVSSSPFPLNDVHLKMVRIVAGGSDVPLMVVFRNGELHSLDLQQGQFKQVARIISDAQLLDAAYPTATNSHAYDSTTHMLSSVVMAGINSYVVNTDLTSFSVSNWKPMTMPPGIITGFGPESFIDAHYIMIDGMTSPQLIIEAESVPTAGFDLMTWLDTSSGALGGNYAGDNLMEDSVLLDCSSYGCDLNQVSAFDPVNQRIIFQGHDESNDKTLSLFAMDWSQSITGNLVTYINVLTDQCLDRWSGFQFVQYASSAKKA